MPSRPGYGPGQSVTNKNMDRSFKVYAGHSETRTDTHGVFALTNLATANAWYVYGFINTFGERALSPRLVNGGEDGEFKDLGNLAAERGLRFAGKVETRNGMCRRAAWKYKG